MHVAVTGLVILVYDHFVTFRAERRLIWTAPTSLAKFGFLVNRYLVPISVLITFLPLSGFIGLHFSDHVRAMMLRGASYNSSTFQACRSVLATLSIIMTCSLALGNGLVAMRVVDLWDYNPVGDLLARSGFLPMIRSVSG
jgi:hypothetical protein